MDKKIVIGLLIVLLVIFLYPKEAGLSSGIMEFDYGCKCIGFTYVKQLSFHPKVYCAGIPYGCNEPERVYEGVTVTEVVNLNEFGCSASYEIYDEFDLSYCQQIKQSHCYITRHSMQDAYNDLIECLCSKMEGSMEFNNTVVEYCEEYFDVRFGYYTDTQVFREMDEVRNLTGYCKQDIIAICANDDFFNKVRIQ